MATRISETGKGWANGDGSGGNVGEGEKRGEGMVTRVERKRGREMERECVCESGGRVVVEERGSVVERPSRCGHELRRSGNVGSV